MADGMKIKILIIPMLILGLFTACSQAPESTDTQTSEGPTTESAVEPTDLPVLEPELQFVPSGVIVDKIEVQPAGDDAGNINIVVQGFTSNACTVVDGTIVSIEGDVLLINVETSFVPDGECKEGTFRFEEMTAVDSQGLSPGNYLITNGLVEKFEFGAGTTAEDTGEETTSAEEAGTEEEAASEEPRDCEDLAIFLADVTYPDNTEVGSGEVFTKTWEIQNTGACTWGAEYEMVFVSGSFQEALSLEIPFPTVAPSETVEVSVVITAPVTADIHQGSWIFQRPEGDNVLIESGDVFNLWAIVIVSGENAASGENRVLKDGIVCAESKAGYENQILELINEARAAEELSAYEMQPQLVNAARRLTTDMACNGFVSQTGSDGSLWFDRIASEGYSYSDAAEIIFFGNAGLPGIAFNWWMDNIEISENILNSEFTQIGVAYALNPQTGGSYYTVVFAAP